MKTLLLCTYDYPYYYNAYEYDEEKLIDLKMPENIFDDLRDYLLGYEGIYVNKEPNMQTIGSIYYKYDTIICVENGDAQIIKPNKYIIKENENERTKSKN